MKKLTLQILGLLCLFLLILSGCAGTRHSYEKLVDESSGSHVITLRVGEKREVIAVGDGFPGRWGYYPSLSIEDTKIAEIKCKDGRSWIPFREPGVVFGGEVCTLYARAQGVTWLRGRAFVTSDRYRGQGIEKIKVAVTEDTGAKQ